MEYSNYLDAGVGAETEENNVATFRVFVVCLPDFVTLAAKTWVFGQRVESRVQLLEVKLSLISSPGGFGGACDTNQVLLGFIGNFEGGHQ